MGSVFDSLVSHLTNAHTNFLQKWDQLIDLEAKEVEVQYKVDCELRNHLLTIEYLLFVNFIFFRL